MPIKVNDVANRCVTTSAVGYMCLGFSLWMISMTHADWYHEMYTYGVALLIPLAALLGLMGIFAYLHGRSLDSVVFFGGTGLLWSLSTASLLTASPSAVGEPLSYGGWYWAGWTVFFGYLWMGAFKAGLARQLFLLGLTIALGASALYSWTGVLTLSLISGYVGMISALIALVASGSDIIAFGREGHSPNDDHRTGQPYPT